MYSGFWKRFAAYILDTLALFVLSMLFLLLWAGFELLLDLISVDQKTKEMILGALGVPLYLSIAWFYFALFESSRLSATLGKLVLDMNVVDKNMKRLTFASASLRYWSKIVSIIPLCYGLIMAGFTSRKQALHDKIAGTYVINKNILKNNPIESDLEDAPHIL